MDWIGLVHEEDDAPFDEPIGPKVDISGVSTNNQPVPMELPGDELDEE